MSTEVTVKVEHKVEDEYFKELALVLRQAKMTIVDGVYEPGDCVVEFTFYDTITQQDIRAIHLFFQGKDYHISAYDNRLTLFVLLRKPHEEE
jgi:hypothetical protein